MSAESLHILLQRIATASYENEISFVIDAVPQFVRALGYADNFLLFEHRLTPDQRYIADAIVTASPAVPPRLLIEAKGPRFTRAMTRDAEEQIRAYRLASESELAVLFTPRLLSIFYGASIDQFDLPDLTRDQATTIFNLLKSPPNWPPTINATPLQSNNIPIISFEHFSVDRAVLSDAISAVEVAQTNDEKGTSLEELAALLFGGLSGMRVKYRNLLGASSEIDLVLEYSRTAFTPAVDEFGRHSIVECKNWAVPVAAKNVRDFKVKLDKSRITLGFLLARNGVTGVHDGADALREIHSSMDRDGKFIIVITHDDITAVLSGSDFHQIIDDKIDRLRFDL